MKSPILIVLFFYYFIGNCQNNIPKNEGIIADKAMVVSARAEASQIGLEIIKQGGNAFDAMIATELALAVSYPFAGNIGGGGFMVFRLSDGTKGALDYREKAPMAAQRDMYLDENKNIIAEKSLLGAHAVGVPGTIAGIFEVYEKFGSLLFTTLIQPSIKLAKEGYVLTENDVNSINWNREKFRKVNDYIIPFDKDFKVGDTIKLPELAKTFERIRDFGRNEFYGGTTGKMMINYIQKLEGIMTLADLQQYKAVWREPISFSYKNFQITSMNLPSSGGICIGQIIKSIEPYDIQNYKPNSSKYIQLIVEAERRAYADRAFFLGDADFIDVPIKHLLSEDYIKQRMSNFTWKKATLSSDVTHGNVEIVESNETTHYSIVDAFGNAVSVTTTLNGAYGSKLYVPEAGFFLNNEMDDFSIKPGTPNMFGLIGAEANAIAPEKRMLSSMSPTIVEEDGKLKMVLGSPGGSTIITSVLQNILNVIEYNMTMQESVNQPRFHHQWLPDEVMMEPNGFDSKTIKNLKRKGYLISEKQSVILGKVDAILIRRDGKLEGGADPRGNDTAVGY